MAPSSATRRHLSTRRSRRQLWAIEEAVFWTLDLSPPSLFFFPFDLFWLARMDTFFFWPAFFGLSRMQVELCSCFGLP
jgi:hypothetical protein